MINRNRLPINDATYESQIEILKGADISAQRFRLASAQEMIIACEELMNQTKCCIADRLPRAKEERNELARLVSSGLSREWKSYVEWSKSIQHALQNARQQRLRSHITELDEWHTWAEQETDIHISAKCSRETILLFLNDRLHVPANTSVFAVPADWCDFVGSLISGEIRPAVVACVDATKAPACHDGMYPKYAPYK
ncbi:hypothetical protein ACVWV0_003445 [Ewingella americana]